VWLLACDDGPEPPSGRALAEQAAVEMAAEKAVEAATEETEAEASEPAVPAADVEPAELVLIWEGIGALHRSFFSNPDLTAPLSRALGVSLQGASNIYVRHDGENFAGQIRLQLRPGTLRVPVPITQTHVQLQHLVPITRALATYRSQVAARFDFRIESFEIGIESFRGASGCILRSAGGPPPDGTVVSPCVEINGAEHCGVAEASGTRFAPEIVKKLGVCLAP